MKMTKRIMAVLLAVFMLAALAVVPASAAGTGTITVENPIVGAEYKLYEMFSVQEIGSGYYYYIVDEWKEFFVTGAGKDYANLDATGTHLIWTGMPTTDAGVAVFAKEALAWAREKLSPLDTAKATGGTVAFAGLDSNAYYLLGSSVGDVASTAILATGDTKIKEKNVLTAADPKIEKKISEETVYIGQVFDVTVTITAGAAGDSYKLVDTMQSAYTLCSTAEEIVVAYNGTALTRNTDYTITTDGTSFTVIFNKEYAQGDTFTVTYKAMLNATAEMLRNYVNTAELTYATDRTMAAYDTVCTLSIEGSKYYMDKQIETPLAGAEFKLKMEIDGVDYWYKLGKDGTVSWVTNEAEGTSAVSSSEPGHVGHFHFQGIAAGKYVMVETKAPDGYTSVADTEVNLSSTTTTIKVENVKGTVELPTTGGIGTTVFYVVGLVLVLGAVVLLLNKKRAA